MTPSKNTIFCGGNLEVVKPWPANCIDSICTDPPYGLEFMGKEWDKFDPKVKKELWRAKGYQWKGKTGLDNLPAYMTNRTQLSAYQEWFTVWAKAMLRITKPGGFLLCFGGTRTYHRLACAIEDAGWEIRDCMMWLYGSGFPKSHNISKAIDKAARGFPQGTNRVDPLNPNAGKYKTQRTEGKRSSTDKGQHFGAGPGQFMVEQGEKQKDIPITPLAQLWDGYGTALKPAWEPIIVAMKPLDGTFAYNAEVHGVAGLNIDAARIGTGEKLERKLGKTTTSDSGWKSSNRSEIAGKDGGRWPANLILDEEAAAMLDEQTQNVGNTKPHKVKSNREKYEGYGSITHKSGETVNYDEPNTKGASRFFYCAKTSRRERNMGCEDMPEKRTTDGCIRANPETARKYQANSALRKNTHPTVKPLALMKYLCTLLKMPSADQIILDPFLGSGTTGIACKELGINFIGIEKEREYCEIAVKRIAAVPGQEITLETTLPVTKNVETVRATTGFVSGGGRPNENSPHVSESRQSIINAAVAALREKRK